MSALAILQAFDVRTGQSEMGPRQRVVSTCNLTALPRVSPIGVPETDTSRNPLSAPRYLFLPLWETPTIRVARMP